MTAKERYRKLLQGPELTVSKLFLVLCMVFTIGGIFGFVYEEIFYFFDLGMWVKRGSTMGPWIPIYGWGAVMLAFFARRYMKKPWLIFAFSVIATFILEFGTGWFLLKYLHVRLWDYNKEILNYGNIGGFVCLRSVLFFGVAGLFLGYVVFPFIFYLEEKCQKVVFLLISVLPAGLFFIDFFYSSILKLCLKV